MPKGVIIYHKIKFKAMNLNTTTKRSTEQETTPFGNVLLPAVLLFLDDYRMPIDCASYMYRKGVDCRIYHKEWSIVRSYWQFVKWIEENGLPDFISFDHDLADVFELKEELPIEQWFDLENNKEYTGMDCAKWLVDYCLDNNKPLPKYAVHSANPAGAENIERLFLSFLKNGR